MFLINNPKGNSLGMENILILNINLRFHTFLSNIVLLKIITGPLNKDTI